MLLALAPVLSCQPRFLPLSLLTPSLVIPPQHHDSVPLNKKLSETNKHYKTYIGHPHKRVICEHAILLAKSGWRLGRTTLIQDLLYNRWGRDLLKQLDVVSLHDLVRMRDVADLDARGHTYRKLIVR